MAQKGTIRTLKINRIVGMERAAFKRSERQMPHLVAERLVPVAGGYQAPEKAARGARRGATFARPFSSVAPRRISHRCHRGGLKPTATAIRRSATARKDIALSCYFQEMV